jgi:hypothetical protein
MSLFAKAKKSATPKTKKAKDEKVRISIEDSSFFDKIQKLQELSDTLKSAKAKSDMISDEIKELGKSEWVKLYSEMAKNPGSVMLENTNEVDDTAQVMFVPADRYITINEDRAEELTETYGEGIVEEETTFSFDSKMIEKYGEVLSKLIEDSDEIDDKDKEKIIKATTKYSITKGTIDKMMEYGDIESVFENVRPVISLKGAEVIKS